MRSNFDVQDVAADVAAELVRNHLGGRGDVVDEDGNVLVQCELDDPPPLF